MYSNLAFAIALLGIFSIFELLKGNQKISLIKYHFIARLILLSAGSFFDYLELAGYEIPYYREVFKLITALIIANQGAFDGNAFAATVCNEYSVTVDGVKYGDWYLPSKYELNLLYLQKSVVGGFANFNYWSSTEIAAAAAWCQLFYNGYQVNYDKKTLIYVRAIRSF